MSKRFAVLPCNGLDKYAGEVSRRIAVRFCELTGSEIICPVAYQISDSRYAKTVEECRLIVLDGCGTRCASKIAAAKGLKVTERLDIGAYTKGKNISLENDFFTGAVIDSLVENAADELLNLTTDLKSNTIYSDDGFFPLKLTYENYQKDKFIFRVPKDKGFYFNENDVWVYVSGNRARVGITDYVQKSMSDIIYFNPPEIGTFIAQFDGLGSAESGKAIFEVISPVSGVVTSVNEKLIDSPELLNQNPYEQGWIAEIESNDFTEDRELLYTFKDYMPIMKRKVDEYRVKD